MFYAFPFMPAQRVVMRCSLLFTTAILFFILFGTDRCPTVPPAYAAQHEAGRESEHTDETLLLLKSGRMIKGVVQHSPNGYVVEEPTGQIVVPFDMVRFEATDLRDAYAKLQRAMPYATASQHIALAQWCLINELFDQARDELRDALLLEPQRQSARTMLKRLESVIGHPKTASSRNTSAGSSDVEDARQTLEAHSLAGLTREQGQTYVQTIQPILMNKCASASCHGSEAANAFRLTRIHPGRGSHRVFAERNLAATLKFIDREDPDRSPLLVRSAGNHGKAGRTIFFGASGAYQSAALRDWVRAVAHDQQEPTPSKQLWPALAGWNDNGTPAEDASTGHPDRTSPERLSNAGENGFYPPADDRHRQQEDDSAAFLEELLRDKKPDAFDPAAFNQETRSPGQ